MPSPAESALLVAGGFVAGFINTLAGGGSFLTVPLLVLVGLPPTVANATNRVAVLAQNLAAITGFRQEGVPGVGFALRLLPAALLGAWLGAWLAAGLPEEIFSRAFGVIMLVISIGFPTVPSGPFAPAEIQLLNTFNSSPVGTSFPSGGILGFASPVTTLSRRSK